MVTNEELLAWAVLARTPSLDASAVGAALMEFGSALGIVQAGAREGSRLPPAAREYLRRNGGDPRPTERLWLKDGRHFLLPFTDARFPKLLRGAPDCPVALYVAGNVDALSDPQLALVGSRQPTPQGAQIAFDFAEHLAARGLAIVSGLALGIDSAAHRGALAAQGVTVAVLGCGIDVLYPPDNRRLAQDITHDGALVSELALGTPPRRGNFPRRNRIIAGLALGTLVIEAARRSGSLITARSANEQGREVFAVPGSILNPLSRGCHELIKQGAILAETPDDILAELNFSAFFSTGAMSPAPAPGLDPNPAGMDKEHKILLDALGFDPTDLDTLVVRTGFKPEAVSSMMLILELKGHVQAASGGRYSRVANRRAGGER
jgi:DNA processing protein